MDLAVLQVVGEQDLVAERLESALAFHRSVSDHAAAHLNLLLDNSLRTPFAGAGALAPPEERHLDGSTRSSGPLHIGSNFEGHQAHVQVHNQDQAKS